MAIRTVGSGGDYAFTEAGITAAIAACSSGDTVRIIQAGTITLTTALAPVAAITIEGDISLYSGYDKTTLPKLFTSGSTRAIACWVSNINIRNLQMEGFLITSSGNAGGAINGQGNTFGTLENLFFTNCVSCIQQGVGGTFRDIRATNVGRLMRSCTGPDFAVFECVQRSGYDFVFDNGSDTTGVYALGAVYQDGSRTGHSVANLSGTGPTMRNISAYRAAGSGGTAFKGTYSYCTQTGYGTLGSGSDGGENYTRDPLFADAANGDFTFELTSLEIDSGTAISGVTTDMLGQTLPVGSGWPRGSRDLVTDTTPPTVTRARMTSKTTIEIVFSEDVDETSAETTGNYTLSPAVSFTAALTDTDTVTLTLTPGVDAVRLTVDNVEDLVGNAMAAAYSVELGWAESEGSEDLPWGVTASGAPVDYLRTWDPMPSGVGSELSIERLVFVSVMSDARLNDDETPTDGTGDRRGWWGDTYSDRPDNTGSRIWHLLSRAGVTAREFEDAVRAALQWMVTDRLCSGIVPVATIRANRVSITVDVTLNSGELLTIPFPDLWSAYAR